jgi:hypothetical protein
MRRAAVFTGGALALCLAPAAWAASAPKAPKPQGNPFRVTSCANCRQEKPVVAGLASGSFLTIWEGTSVKDGNGISGRLFNATGAAAAADFLVNKDAAPDQFDAAIARDTQGNFIAVWSEVANGNSEIKAQRFLPTGAPLGNPIQVSADPVGTPPPPADFNPVVARTKDGFVVVWMRLVQGNNPEVLARRFSVVGAPLAPPAKISTGLVNGNRPDVCVDTSGQTIAVWTNVDQIVPFQSNRKGVSLRRLSATGAPLGPEQVVVVPQATSVQPAVSCGNGSTFVVVWHTDLPPAADRTDILAQRYSRLGRKVGQPFRINSNITGYQRNPSIAHDAKGNFVVAWQADLGTREGIYGRRFNTSGTATGLDFEVVVDNDNATEPAYPRVDHIGKASNFVIVWQDGSRAIMGRRYTP